MKFSFERTIVPKKRINTSLEIGAPELTKNGVQVLISTYNCGAYLERCLRSVEKALQGFKWLLIIADDDSSDNTQAIVKSHQTTAQQVIYQKFAKSKNAAQAKNRAVDLSRKFFTEYPWLCFMDADDAMGELRIKKLLNGALSGNHKAVFGDYVLHTDDPQPVYRQADYRSQSTGRIPPWSTLIHYSLVPEKEPFFPEDFDAYEECVLFIRWYKKGLLIVPCPDIVTHHYYVRGNSAINPDDPFTKARNKEKYDNIKSMIINETTAIDITPHLPIVTQLKVNKKLYESIHDISTAHLSPGQYHFNCGMLDYKEKRLLAYRWDVVDSDKPAWISHTNVHICMTELDNNFQPIPNTNKKLNLPLLFDDDGNSKHEDPRLFTFKGELYCSYVTASLKLQLEKKPCASMGLAKLDDDWNVIANWWLPYGNNVTKEGKELTYPAEPRGPEKNWTFFEFEEELYCVYTINPHSILKVDLKNNKMIPIDETIMYPQWRHGELRGGTPPIRIGDEYFAFFHSSFRYINNKIFPHPIYVMGMYGFEAKAPFRVTRLSKSPILMGDIHGHIWSTAVVFPNGAIYKDGKWAISYGYNDYASKVVVLDHDKLLADCEKVIL